jgi:hypothetical protein
VAIPPASGAAASEATTVVGRTIYGPWLDRPKINKLAQAVASGITPPRVDFETNWHGTRLRATSLQGLLRAADQCLQPGDSRRLDTLELSSTGHDRRVRVIIGEQAATVEVEAEAAWAIGKAEQIRDILLHARGSSRLRRWRETHLSLAGTIASFAVVAAAFLLGLLAVDLRSIVLAAASIIATAAIGYLVGRWRAARNRTLIWVAGALPKRGWAGWSTTDRIAAVTVLVGLLGVVVTLF